MESQAIRLMNGKTIEPVGNKLYFRRMYNDDPEFLVLPYTVREKCNLCELIGVGPECKYLTQSDIGGIAELPETDNSLHRLSPMNEKDGEKTIMNEDWCMDEDRFMEVVGCLIENSED